MISQHLRVPMGLVVDNTRDFFMDDSLDKEGDTKIEQTHDDTMDYLYETMVLNHQKKTKKSANKTKKKRRLRS
jgi:hypothetical protein